MEVALLLKCLRHIVERNSERELGRATLAGAFNGDDTNNGEK